MGNTMQVGRGGSPGSKGDTGERGDKGTAGDRGLPGSKGERGNAGLAGITGERVSNNFLYIIHLYGVNCMSLNIQVFSRCTSYGYFHFCLVPP